MNKHKVGDICTRNTIIGVCCIAQNQGPSKKKGIMTNGGIYLAYHYGKFL
jgi:hypothetical protein